MATVDIKVPSPGESITEVRIAQWLVKDGDVVSKDQVIAEIDSDKATLELSAESGGQVKLLAAADQTVNVGDVVAKIDTSVAAPAKSAEKAAPAKEEKAPAKSEPAKAPVATAAASATPVAKAMLDEKGLSADKVKGTGPNGRVTKSDVSAYVSGGVKADAIAMNGWGGSREQKRSKMTSLRQTVAKRLVMAKNQTAMLTTFNEVDMTRVMALRARYKEGFEKKHGIGLGFMSFFVKAAANALMEFPTVNAYLVKDNEGHPAVQKHGYADIAIAVSTPKGLVVPVLRSAERMSFAAVESGIKQLATRARDGKLTLEEMQGGTFTITNGGVFGSLMSTPILNPPQSAILGMHATKNRAVEDPDEPGKVVIRPMMYLALSYDHRMVDGEGAVRFLVRIKDQLENPERILLEV